MPRVMPSTPKHPRRHKDERSAAAVFGANLRAARLAAGRTQAEIAHAAGVSQNKLPPIEQGQIDVRLSTARKLARAVGGSLRDLVSD